MWYVAQARPPRLSEQARDGGQVIPQIDAEVIPQIDAEIAEKGHFWMETR
jgi:hypothetical protein